jgi:hypothetical protein
MKKLLYLSLMLVLLVAASSFAQTQEELNTFNKERLNIQKKGMGVLGIWAIGNIATGIVGYETTDGSVAQLYKMNIIWNGVNLALAIPGYIGASKGKYDLSMRKTYKEQSGVEKTFMFNAGLDAAYIMGGLYLTEKAKTASTPKKHDEHLGYGNSLMFQGGFLMLFDITMAAIHSSHGNKKLMQHLDKIIIGSNGIGYRHQF